MGLHNSWYQFLQVQQKRKKKRPTRAKAKMPPTIGAKVLSSF